MLKLLLTNLILMTTPAFGIIFGEDNRFDLHEITDQNQLLLAKSTGLLTEINRLSELNQNFLKLETKNYGDFFSLCEEEPFVDQLIGGKCSGFLVDSDIFVTAAHCMRENEMCQSTAIIFDYNITEAGEIGKEIINKADTYYCKEIIYKNSDFGGTDVAVLRLDRAVIGRKPLHFRQSGKIADGQEITLIGHPQGLPTKIANNAQVINNEELFYFETNTDSYGGNSGSAVFNASTNEVEGLLVRGADDFHSLGGRECKVSIKQPHTQGRERVVRASRFASVIAEANVILNTKKLISLFSQETVNIPDFFYDGVIQSFSVSEDKTIQTVRLSADITHPYSNDVEIYLITPKGEQMLVQLGSVGFATDLKKTYFVSGLKGTSSKGLWQIKVRDISDGDVGFVNSLKLDLYYE